MKITSVTEVSGTIYAMVKNADNDESGTVSHRSLYAFVVLDGETLSGVYVDGMGKLQIAEMDPNFKGYLQ